LLHIWAAYLSDLIADFCYFMGYALLVLAQYL
jgi:hypothetical protein